MAGIDKLDYLLEPKLDLRLRCRYLEQQKSTYPGCRALKMLDFDMKVRNRVCVNTKIGDKFLALDNSGNAVEPHRVFIPTGCMNEPKRRKRFCDKCLGKFSVNAREGDDVIFLQSLHALGINRQGAGWLS